MQGEVEGGSLNRPLMDMEKFALHAHMRGRMGGDQGIGVYASGLPSSEDCWSDVIAHKRHTRSTDAVWM